MIATPKMAAVDLRDGGACWEVGGEGGSRKSGGDRDTGSGRLGRSTSTTNDGCGSGSDRSRGSRLALCDGTAQRSEQ
jgi:hypothetical protein